jgi:iron complex outermembrane receptor protein
MSPNCVLAGLYDVTGHFSSNRTDWRAGINYRWNDELMTYAQVSTGYKGGGINPRPFVLSQIKSFNPETMTTYEVGAKSDLFDNRVRLNGALFWNKYKDIILTLSACPTSPCALPVNVGAADVKGAELEANFRLGGGFSIDASGSVLDFEYTDVGSTTTGVTKSMITPYTPEQKYSLGLMWEGDIGSSGSLMARADYAYQSEMFSAAINLPLTRIPSYGVYNARLTWRSPETVWETSLEVNNITDKLYYTSNSDWSTSAGSTTFAPAMPRNWAVTFKRNF